MDLAIPKSLAEVDPEVPLPANQGGAGTSSGVNIEPGTHDDGWVVPAPITLRDGTRVQLYKDGEAMHAAYEAIRHAKHRVCLEVYIFASDPTGCAFADLLCAKAQEGVKVFLAYDSFGSIDSDSKMFHRMRRAGVRVEEFHPIWPWEGRFSWRPFNRDHRKLLIVDDDIAGMGGLNIGAEYAGSWVVKSDKSSSDAWRDTSIGMVGPSARFFLGSFASTWKYIHTGGRIRRAEFMHGLDVASLRAGDRALRAAAVRERAMTSDGATASLRSRVGSANSQIQAPLRADTSPDLSILASVPTMSSPLRPLLHRLFAEARQSIRLTMAYFAPDDDLIESLCRAARRGVKVQLMLPGKCDVRLLMIAARSFYATLLEAGVEIFERQGCVLHAKTMVIDDRVSVVGSTNLDYRSIEYNSELSAIIRNEEFGGQMKKLFENDIRFSRRITLTEWRRRAIWDRVVQWGVSRARYLL